MGERVVEGPREYSWVISREMVGLANGTLSKNFFSLTCDTAADVTPISYPNRRPPRAGTINRRNTDKREYSAILI
jgi:hypothetical protein